MSFKKIVKIPNQGFCFGVTRAIEIVQEIRKNNTNLNTIYLLGNLVHNNFIKEYMESLNIKVIDGSSRIEMIESIPDNETIIFSAHGVSDKVRKIAKDKNLKVYDSTCPFVEKTFKQVQDKVNEGYDILFVGKPNHPETEAMLELSNNVHLVNDDIFINKINSNKIIVAHQTTMSKYDISDMFDKILKEYPNAVLLDMICKATEHRQDSLNNISIDDYEGKSIILIIGDKMSNNSNKLYELALRKREFDSLFISSINDLNLNYVKNYENIIIASGTSTPMSIIDEVVDVLNNIDNYNDEYATSKINYKNVV